MPVALGRVLEQETVGTRLTPTLALTDLETAPTRKRKQRTEHSAAQLSQGIVSNAKKRLKTRGNEIRHSPNVVPASPASSLLDDGNDPFIDNPDVGSLAPSPERSKQRKHGSAPELRFERQKSIERIQDARTEGNGISIQSLIPGDSEQRRLVSQGNESQAYVVRYQVQPGLAFRPKQPAVVTREKVKASCRAYSLNAHAGRKNAFLPPLI